MGNVVASALHKLRPPKSEPFLAEVLNRSDNAQAASPEECDWYVLASGGSMHRICRVLLPPCVSLKWLRFGDLRRCFSFADMDRGHVRVQSVALPGEPRGCQFAMATSDQIREEGKFISSHDMPACPSLTLVRRPRQPQASGSAPKRVEGTVCIPSQRFYLSWSAFVCVRTPIALAWRRMLLPCLPSIAADRDQVDARTELVARRGQRNDASSDFTMRPDRQMA